MLKNELVENLHRKGVKKMKKLIVIAIAAAFTISFLPMAEAGDTANLGLSVTFAKNEPLVLYTEPEGPFKVEEGSLLEFKVIAQDPDALTVKLEALSLPDGATFELDDIGAKDNYKRGRFKWTPKEGQGRDEEYKAEFRALSYDEYDILVEKKNLIVSITVRVAPIIAIELNNDMWEIEGIKLGGKVKNIIWRYITDVEPPWPPQPIHAVKNIGNVAVGVDISYAESTGCKPGLKPGTDIFATVLYQDGYVNGVPIPPTSAALLTRELAAEKTKGIPLEYQAPTALSSDINGMSAIYGLRAYPAILPVPLKEE